MTDSPINLHAHEVNAIRDGRQTQVRRVLTLRTASFGDRLWAREAWRASLKVDNYLPKSIVTGELPFNGVPIYYDANDAVLIATESERLITMDRAAEIWPQHARQLDGVNIPGRKRPSLFMPREFSRLTLIVSDVRVQRLQEISRGDAIAEGIERVGGGILRWENWASGIDGVHGFSPEAAFALLWNSINAKRPGCAWDDNPWVVAVTFRAINQNIDQIGDGDGH